MRLPSDRSALKRSTRFETLSRSDGPRRVLDEAFDVEERKQLRVVRRWDRHLCDLELRSKMTDCTAVRVVDLRKRVSLWVLFKFS